MKKILAFFRPLRSIDVRALLSSFIIFHACLCANEKLAQNPSEAQDGRVSVGCRSLSKESFKLMTKERAEEKNDSYISSSAEHLDLSHQFFKFSGSSFFDSLFTHQLKTISLDGDSIEIEDGSWWKITPKDTHTVLTWGPMDDLVITPLNSFSKTYYLTNTSRRGSKVQAKLSVGPITYGEKSHWVRVIDGHSGHVYLENDTRWKISSSDFHLVREWAPNDSIIIGINDAWFSCYEFILINVNMNHFVRANYN